MRAHRWVFPRSSFHVGWDYAFAFPGKTESPRRFRPTPCVPSLFIPCGGEWSIDCVFVMELDSISPNQFLKVYNNKHRAYTDALKYPSVVHLRS